MLTNVGADCLSGISRHTAAACQLKSTQQVRQSPPQSLRRAVESHLEAACFQGTRCASPLLMHSSRLYMRHAGRGHSHKNICCGQARLGALQREMRLECGASLRAATVVGGGGEGSGGLPAGWGHVGL